MNFVFPNSHYARWALLSWEWQNTCLPMRSSEWIPGFALPACMAFALRSKLSLYQATSSCTFTFTILTPIAPGESERAAVWHLSACWVKPLCYGKWIRFICIMVCFNMSIDNFSPSSAKCCLPLLKSLYLGVLKRYEYCKRWCQKRGLAVCIAVWS